MGDLHNNSAQIWYFSSLLGDVQRSVSVSYIFVVGGLWIWNVLLYVCACVYMWEHAQNTLTFYLASSEYVKTTNSKTWALSRASNVWPRCPSANEWIRKLWFIYTMEYYSAIKKNSFESILRRWMKLEPIIQSEVSQKDKDHYNILTHICGI